MLLAVVHAFSSVSYLFTRQIEFKWFHKLISVSRALQHARYLSLSLSFLSAFFLPPLLSAFFGFFHFTVSYVVHALFTFDLPTLFFMATLRKCVAIMAKGKQAKQPPSKADIRFGSVRFGSGERDSPLRKYHHAGRINFISHTSVYCVWALLQLISYIIIVVIPHGIDGRPCHRIWLFSEPDVAHQAKRFRSLSLFSSRLLDSIGFPGPQLLLLK